MRRKRIITLVMLIGLPSAAFVVARPQRCSDRIIFKDSGSTRGNAVLFPTVSAKTLAGRCVTFPKETRGQVGLVFVAFEQRAQTDIDSWVDPLIADYLDSEQVSYYEIPMISGGYKPVSRLIDGGMRGGVPKKLHDKTATFYGDRADFFSSMEITDKKRAYLFVLSRDGRIVYRDSGRATADGVKAASQAIEAEVDKGGQPTG